MENSYFNTLKHIRFSTQEISDIFFWYIIPDKYKNESAFYEYNITNGTRIEHVAHNLYSNVELWWVILLYNKTFDPYYDWPMDNDELEEYANKKSILLHGKDYTMAQYTIIYDELYEHNESISTIKILKPDLVIDMVNNITDTKNYYYGGI